MKVGLSKRRANLIHRSKIEDELKEIPHLPTYYVTKQGVVYHHYGDDMFHKIKSRVLTCGYEYVFLYANKKRTHCRVHRLVALTWIDNPFELPVVGHKNNVKTDNRADNLYWTTYSENTQKAVDDKLLVNDKGFDDSQSFPVACFTSDGVFYKMYGSVTEAHKELGVSKSTILRHANKEVGGSRCGYTFMFKTEYDNLHSLTTIENTFQ